MKKIFNSLLIVAFTLITSVSQANAQAQANLGRNQKEALQLSQVKGFKGLESLANQGNLNAQYILGLSYLHGMMDVEKDDSKAFEWFQKSANQGAPGSEYNLGLMYQAGKGVKQDYSQAFQWFQKAANQDIAGAQYSLGLLYETGKGVKQSKLQAKKWYKKSCQNFSEQGCEAYAKSAGIKLSSPQMPNSDLSKVFR